MRRPVFLKTEKALFAGSLPALKKAGLSGYERLYFGNETCERILPSVQELAKAKKVCSECSAGFSLVTPFVTDQGLKKVVRLSRGLSGDDEVIANDFGVLNAIAKSSRAEPVCGRLLNRQFRDPRIAGFSNAPEELVQNLKLSHAESGLFREMLKGLGVKRVELDNLSQGIGTSLENTGMKATLYWPIAFVSATRFCLTANCDKISSRKKIGIFPCGLECRAYRFELSNGFFPGPLFMIGNALFFENPSLCKEEELAEKGIDRIVTNKALLE